MYPPRSQWGRATVVVPWNRPEAWIGGIVLPAQYELDAEFGAFFSQPTQLGFTLIVRGHDIPQAPDGGQLPQLRCDAHTWNRVVVYPWEAS